MFKNILIIGCGMIGSSILRGAINQKLCKTIYVFEKNSKYLNQIKKINKKIILIKKLDKKIKIMDLVIISTPMSEYQKIIDKLNNNLNDTALITDVGSTRENVAKLVKQKLSKNLNWIMSHPISGSEASGPKYGSKNLFKNKWCILIKSKKNKKSEKKLSRFWKKLGSKVLYMQEEDHDKIFSVTSHLPHLVAYNLIKTAQALTSKLKIESIYCIEPIIQELLTKASINYNDKHYMQCDGIISSCEFLIAQHGKIMLSSKQLGSNNIKNLPKEHIVIAYTSQIVKSLNEGMSGLNKRYIDNLPSTITTIKSQQIQENENTEGNIKNLSVLLIEDYQTPK